MNLYRNLTVAGFALAFVLGLAVTDSNAQRSRHWGSSGRYYGGQTYSRYQPRYSRYYGSRRYSSYNNRGRYGYVSARERRRLARQRYRMMRATQRYYRTRARIINRANRRAYYGGNRYYRNW